jgi:hypothetical protein
MTSYYSACLCLILLVGCASQPTGQLHQVARLVAFELERPFTNHVNLPGLHSANVVFPDGTYTARYEDKIQYFCFAPRPIRILPGNDKENNEGGICILKADLQPRGIFLVSIGYAGEYHNITPLDRPIQIKAKSRKAE